MARRRIPLVWMVLFLAVTVPSAWAELAPETRWADPSSVRLNVEFPGDGYHATWDLFRCDCGDLLVRSELNVPGESVSGELLLVERKAVLSRGFGKYRDQAAASLDAAALMMQLALRLLERSEPGGPSRVEEPLVVGLEDTINHINLDTGTAVGGFQAPWSIEGEIAPSGDSRRRFDLQFVFTVPTGDDAQQASMRLHGEADYARAEFPVAGSSELEGWDLSWRNAGDAVPGTAATLDELRSLLRGN